MTSKVLTAVRWVVVFQDETNSKGAWTAALRQVGPDFSQNIYPFRLYLAHLKLEHITKFQDETISKGAWTAAENITI